MMNVLSQIVPRLSLFLLLTAFLTPIAGPAFGQSTSDADAGTALLQRVQQNYEAADGLRATFTQQTRSPFSEDTVTFEGTLLLQGAKYRIETRQQTLVTDGTTTWIYNPATSQVIINQYVNDETIITPDEIFTDYLERYNIETTQASDRDGSIVAIDLAAADTSAYYTDVTVHVRRSDAMLTRVRLEDQNGATTLFRLDDIQLNPTFDPEAFTFSPPPDADVVDLRS
jgi:outer membrane lipoprotein carrier protein